MTTRDQLDARGAGSTGPTPAAGVTAEPAPSLPERLSAARERKGVDLDRAERDTKIRARYLGALERGDYRDLPGAVYTKGFLRNYALYLGLDPDEVLRQWRQERGDAGSSRRSSSSPRPLEAPRAGPELLADRRRRRAADGRSSSCSSSTSASSSCASPSRRPHRHATRRRRSSTSTSRRPRSRSRAPSTAGATITITTPGQRAVSRSPRSPTASGATRSISAAAEPVRHRRARPGDRASTPRRPVRCSSRCRSSCSRRRR